jgi:hypothetical protein
MNKLYEKRFLDEKVSIEIDENKKSYVWSPELFGHRGWNLKVADVTGFEQCMLRPSWIFSLRKTDGYPIFCYDFEEKEFIISKDVCACLLQNSVQL